MWQASPELRALADAAYAAINAGDLDAFLAIATDDVEFTSMVAEAEGATFRGHDGVRAWWETIRGAFQGVRWELLDLQGSENWGVARIRITGTMSGVPVEQTMWQAVKLRDGKARWWALFRSEREALGAVGLPAEANAAVARQTFKRICRRDIDGLLELYDPEIEFLPLTGTRVESGGYLGHAGVRDYFAEADEVWEEMQPHADDVRTAGDDVVILGGCAVRGRGSGARSDNPMAWVLTLRNGKVVRHRGYATREEALDAVGLPE